MNIKQLSIFVENKKGRLADITEILSDVGANIRALSIADTTDFGILRLIVDDPDAAALALKDAGVTVSITNVIAVGIDDVPGAFARPMRILSDAGIDVEYMYAFITRKSEKAYVILRVADNDAAAKVLNENGVELLDNEGFHAMM
ncbi:MAG: ACT domain-containing protein [Acutalibacteraceae bacterium]|nr:ACT domain-containing protein [Acutalibacteraceae bacterium]